MLNAADASPEDPFFVAPHLPPEHAWPNAFLDEYERLHPDGDFDFEIVSDYARIAYDHTDARDMSPWKAVTEFMKNEAPWVLETRRIADKKWRNPKPAPAVTVQDSIALNQWINDTTTELHKRLPGTSARDLKGVAIGLAFDDDFKDLAPAAAAAQWEVPKNPDGSNQAPF